MTLMMKKMMMIKGGSYKIKQYLNSNTGCGPPMWQPQENNKTIYKQQQQQQH